MNLRCPSIRHVSSALLALLLFEGCGLKLQLIGAPDSGDSSAVGSSGLHSGSPAVLATDWNYLGEPGTAGGNWNISSFALDSSGTPYVAFRDSANGSKLTVKRWTGVSWAVVGSAGFSSGMVASPVIAFDRSDHPLVLFSDYSVSSKASVMAYDGSSWNLLGPAGLSGGTASYFSVATDLSGHPYIAYFDFSSFQIAVQHWDGASWNTLSAPGNVNDGPASLATDSLGAPYLAYHNTTSSNLTVAKWTGSSWQALGTSLGSPNQGQASLRLDSSNTPFVAFVDASLGNGKIRVRTWDGSAWQDVGSPGFSSFAENGVSLSLDSAGNPYVAFPDYGKETRVTVMHWDGASWETAGAQGFSEFGTSGAALAIDSADVPIVAFLDTASGNMAVMRYGDDQAASSLGWTQSSPQAPSTVAAQWAASLDSSAIDEKIQYYSDAYCGTAQGSPIDLGSEQVTQDAIAGSASQFLSYRVFTVFDDATTAYSRCSTPMGFRSVWSYVGGFNLQQSLRVGHATPGAWSLDDSGKAYAAIRDASSSGAFDYQIASWDGTAWSRSDSTRFSLNQPSNSQPAAGAIAIANAPSSGTLYVAYSDAANSGRITVVQWNGSSWTALGSAGFSAGAASEISISVDGFGDPTILYEQTAGVTAQKWNGSSWVTLGASGFDGGANSAYALVLDSSGNPYVAYADYSTGKAVVTHWNGSAWTSVGSEFAPNSWANELVISLDTSGYPYVATTDFDDMQVWGWNGTAWSQLGSGLKNYGNMGFSLSRTGVPYLATVNLSGQATVLSWNGSAWNIVGASEVSTPYIDTYEELLLAFDASNNLYVMYDDEGLGSVLLRRFDP